MVTRQKIGANSSKCELVRAAAEYLGGQKNLVEAMNKLKRFDGRTTSKVQVSRWIHTDRKVNGFDAMWIDQATGGYVKCEWFHKGFKKAFADTYGVVLKKAA